MVQVALGNKRGVGGHHRTATREGPYDFFETNFFSVHAVADIETLAQVTLESLISARRFNDLSSSRVLSLSLDSSRTAAATAAIPLVLDSDARTRVCTSRNEPLSSASFTACARASASGSGAEFEAFDRLRPRSTGDCLSPEFEAFDRLRPRLLDCDVSADDGLRPLPDGDRASVSADNRLCPCPAGDVSVDDEGRLGLSAAGGGDGWSWEGASVEAATLDSSEPSRLPLIGGNDASMLL